MFGLFKKRKKEVQTKGYYAFVDGKSIDITEVPDEMFATKMLGDGIAIQPSSDEFVSPCNGKITTIMDSKHAIGIENEDGIQILIHIGLDTVNLGGEGFHVHCAVGDQVTVGTPLVTVDRSLVKSNNLKDVTMMVFVELNGHTIKNYCTDKTMTGGKSLLLEYV